MAIGKGGYIQENIQIVVNTVGLEVTAISQYDKGISLSDCSTDLI